MQESTPKGSKCPMLNWPPSIYAATHSTVIGTTRFRPAERLALAEPQNDRIIYGQGLGNLLSIEHAAARLIDHLASQTTIVLDVLADFFDHHVGKQILAERLAGVLKCHSCTFHDLLGNADELAICAGLLLAALPRRHPLDLVHPTPCRTPAIAKTLDTSQFQQLAEASDQACDDAHDIPQ